MRVERPLRLHGALTPTCAKCMPASQVSLKSERPAVGHTGAALRSLVIKKASLHCTPTSFRHEPQVCRGGSFTACLPGGFSHVPPLSPLLCRVLLRRIFAALAASAVTIISAIQVVAAVAVGSRIDDSILLHRLRWLPRVAAGVFDAVRRLDGGRCGAAAWRPWPGDPGGRCGRHRRLASCFFRSACRFRAVCRMSARLPCKNAFSRRCGCMCVRSVCASAIPNPCTHVDMRGVCVRDR